jgi:hypothetical protein
MCRLYSCFFFAEQMAKKLSGTTVIVKKVNKQN